MIDAIEAHVAALAQIEKSARTVRKHGDNILTSAGTIRDALEREVEQLRSHVGPAEA